MYKFSPSRDYRNALKRGMSGTDVAVLQLNMQLEVDGAFGPVTEKAVKSLQAAKNLKVDGIAGLATQRAIALREFAAVAGPYKLPVGLLESVASNESGFALAAYSPHPSDAGFDIGVLQCSVTPGLIGNQAHYKLGYSARQIAVRSAADLRKVKDGFYGKPGAKTHRRAWELAVINHNWPSAAANMAAGGGPYKESARNSRAEPWIVAASGGRLSTPNQWVSAYIERCTALVTRWTQ